MSDTFGLENRSPASGGLASVSADAPLTGDGTSGSHLGISPATTGAAGSMSAADKTKLDGVTAGATNTPLASTAPASVGSAAVGTGTTAARDDHVHAHGNQSGGSLHSAAVAAGAAGFMSGSDKSKLDGIATSATNTPLSSATPQAVGSATAGSGTSAARDDHVHAHGNQAGGSLHADVIAGGASGFMSGSDKTKLNAVPTPASSFASLASSPHNVTGSWADVGLNLSLTAGSWLVIAEVLGFANTASPAAGDEGIIQRLYDATAGAVIVSSERPLVLLDEQSLGGYRQGTITEVVTVGVTSSIRVQAMDVGGSTPLANAQIHSNGTFGRSRITAVRIA